MGFVHGGCSSVAWGPTRSGPGPRSCVLGGRMYVRLGKDGRVGPTKMAACGGGSGGGGELLIRAPGRRPRRSAAMRAMVRLGRAKIVCRGRHWPASRRGGSRGCQGTRRGEPSRGVGRGPRGYGHGWIMTSGSSRLAAHGRAESRCDGALYGRGYTVVAIPDDVGWTRRDPRVDGSGRILEMVRRSRGKKGHPWESFMTVPMAGLISGRRTLPRGTTPFGSGPGRWKVFWLAIPW